MLRARRAKGNARRSRARGSLRSAYERMQDFVVAWRLWNVHPRARRSTGRIMHQQDSPRVPPRGLDCKNRNVPGIIDVNEPPQTSMPPYRDDTQGRPSNAYITPTGWHVFPGTGVSAKHVSSYVRGTPPTIQRMAKGQRTRAVYPSHEAAPPLPCREPQSPLTKEGPCVPPGLPRCTCEPQSPPADSKMGENRQGAMGTRRGTPPPTRRINVNPCLGRHDRRPST